MEFLKALHIKSENAGSGTGTEWISTSGDKIASYSPVDGKLIGTVQSADKATYEKLIAKAEEAFRIWRTWPAPKRGEIVRQVGEA